MSVSRGRWLREWVAGEEANSFAMMLVMFPMLIAALGLGIDVSHNSWLRQELQASADMAVVSAAGQTVTSTSTGRSTIVPNAQAFATLRQVYQANRNARPGTLNCLSGNTARCWVESTAPAITNNRTRITFTLREQSNNGFLHTVGIPTQTYTIRATARVNQDTQ